MSNTRLKLDYLALQHGLPTGVYVIPSGSAESLYAVIFVHRGYYAGGCFRFTLDQTSARPVVTFQTSVFHPLVDASNGQMNLDGRFAHWKPGDSVSQLLHYIKASFKRAVLDDLPEAVCPHKEAWRLYRNQTNLFAQLAAQSAELSITENSLYGIPKQPTPIRFSRLTEEEEKRAREAIGLH